MRVSIIVPTYRRPQVLSRCLEALAGQDRAPDEVIVVVRREDDASARVVREHGGLARLVPIDVPPGSPGVVMALNAGAAASSGEIVCLTDDDAEPRPGWIARIHETFALDSSIGAVGGRDWLFLDGQRQDGVESKVGTVSWFGRTTGNHHLGAGLPRDVDVLKGVNLSVRGDLIREVGFDTRLQAVTTEHHWELALCLKLLRMGCRIVYDPAIEVDHRPQPRIAEDRERGERDVRDAAHNETLAMLEHLPPHGKALHLAWTVAVGSRAAPGLASSMRGPLSGQGRRLALLRGNLSGRRRAVGTYLGSRSSRGSKRSRRGAPARRRRRVLSVCQSPAATQRAEQLLAAVADVEVIAPGPGARGMLRSASSVLSARAGVLYLVDVGKATTVAALLGRLTRRRVIVDTGDAGFALARSLGERGFLGQALVGLGEQLALRCADEIVVRGRLHADHVPRPATHIPDLAPPGAGPVQGSGLRRELGLQGAFVVGVVGSLIFSPRHRTSYGWDLVEALPLTDPSVAALIVGDGSGLQALRDRAKALGVAERCRFVGSVPADRVSAYVSSMNAAISTQTNDLVGRVRTTGKLPLYLACGCPVLATDVGEAARVLGPHGWTLGYAGVVDPSYPTRLAEAIEAWRLHAEGEPARRQTALDIAASEFDADELRARFERLLSDRADPGPGGDL